jgi:hypothetical protein
VCVWHWQPRYALRMSGAMTHMYAQVQAAARGLFAREHLDVLIARLREQQRLVRSLRCLARILIDVCALQAIVERKRLEEERRRQEEERRRHEEEMEAERRKQEEERRRQEEADRARREELERQRREEEVSDRVCVVVIDRCTARRVRATPRRARASEIRG